MKRIASIILLLLVTLSGCRDSLSGKLFRYDIPSPVDNLDPQYATDSTARMIIMNIFDPLVTQEPGGTIKLCAAENYNVSPDGLEYVFRLREDAVWSGKDGLPVTADDFVFAFQRMFSGSTPSPYAGSFIAIKNASDILDGLKPPEDLGVTAISDYKLKIELEYSSPFFLELLASTAAVPANRAAVTQARGRYGLEKDYISSNGAFVLESWSRSQISLRKNTGYHSAGDIPALGVNIYIGRDNTVERFFNGSTDVCIIPYERADEARNGGIQVLSYDRTTWCIVFNQKDSALKSPLIRQALAASLEYGLFSEHLTANYKPTSLLVPPEMKISETPFMEHIENKSPLPYEQDDAKRLFSLGLESLGMNELPQTAFLVPDSGGHALNMGLAQQGWQKILSAFITMTRLPENEIRDRLEKEDYQILLMPFTPSGSRMENLLGAFSSGSSQNYFGYGDPRYDDLLAAAASEQTLEGSVRNYIQAQAMLISDAVVIPVYTETTCFAVSKGISGFEIQPFGGLINFRYGVSD